MINDLREWGWTSRKQSASLQITIADMYLTVFLPVKIWVGARDYNFLTGYL